MHVAILGGSFDPPHLGHILIARQVKELLPVDQVWLMPCFNHTFQKELSPSSDRLAMTKFLEEKNIVVSDFEITIKSLGITIETLRALSKKHPNDKFSWIIGSDQLEAFHKWEEWETLIREFSFIIFPREVALRSLPELVKKHLLLKAIPKNITFMQSDDLILMNISSTLVRKRVRKGLSIDLLVHPKVKEYIEDKKLYL